MPTTKNLSPSKLRRKERRKEETYTKETIISENDVSINVKPDDNIIHSANISNMCSSNTSLPHSMPLSSSFSLPNPMSLSSSSPYLILTYMPNLLSNHNHEPNDICEQCKFNHFPHPCWFSQKKKVQIQKCAKCRKDFNTENELKEHLERNHHYCKQCGLFYQDIFALKCHTNVITNCSPSPYRKT